MSYLFIHPLFPGQFVHIARDLVARGHSVTALAEIHREWITGVTQITYAVPHSEASARPSREFERAAIRGEAVYEVCKALRDEGFMPKVIIGHSGWGDLLFLKDLWPRIPLLGYFEFHYSIEGADVGFDPEFPHDDRLAQRLRCRNAFQLASLEAVDWGLTPTRWQRDQFPEPFRSKLTVLHEGIDTALAKPDPEACQWLEDGTPLRYGDEIMTYCARNLEPYRGFHVFMRALPRILAERPMARVLIMGGDDVSYGVPPDSGESWRDRMLAEVGEGIDRSRVHFLGWLPYQTLISVLNVSRVHCYLTYPFILSWSLMDALSAGCLIVASKTPPVQEVIEDGHNGHLFDFFDVDGLADRVIDALADRSGRDGAIRAAARSTIIRDHDLETCSLPRYRALLQSLAAGTRPDGLDTRPPDITSSLERP